MRKSLLAAGVSIAALAVASSQPLVAQGDVDQQLGSVHFETSCNDVAQRRFDRAMRYQHSFWYEQAKEIFEEAAKADPSCAIAHWGVALTLLSNPHIAIPAANLAPGLAAIQKAKSLNAKTERERDYIDALAVMYVDHDKLSHRERIGAFLKKMEALATKYPDDDEAQIAYAITLNTSASPADKTYAQQMKGAQILEPISKRLRASWGYSLSDPSVRLSVYRGEGPRRGKPICQGCARCTSRPAYAFPHLHTGR